MNYGKALRIARAMAGLQQKELAHRAKVNPSHISLIEIGQRKPSAKVLEQLCRALRIPTHLFMLLGAEAQDLNIRDEGEIQRAAESLARLLFADADKPRKRRPRRRPDSEA